MSKDDKDFVNIDRNSLHNAQSEIIYQKPISDETRLIRYRTDEDHTFAPMNWAFCQGQVLNIAQYSALYAILGTQFGGNALISAVADKVIEIIQRDDLCGRAARLGDWLRGRLEGIKSRLPEQIAEVRVHGLMIGIELTHPGAEVWKALLERGFVLNLTQDTVLRLLPPLVITEEELEAFCRALESVLTGK